LRIALQAVLTLLNREFANQLSIPFLETSALNATNVEQTFLGLHSYAASGSDATSVHSSFTLTHPRLSSSFGFKGKVLKTSQEMVNTFLLYVLGQANHDAIEDYRCRIVRNTERMDAYRQSVMIWALSLLPLCKFYI